MQVEYEKGNTDTTLKLDSLGPIVVGTDGTLSRITNWDTMGQKEQERTQRIIVIRNANRLKALEAIQIVL